MLDPGKCPSTEWHTYSWYIFKPWHSYLKHYSHLRYSISLSSCQPAHKLYFPGKHWTMSQMAHSYGHMNNIFWNSSETLTYHSVCSQVILIHIFLTTNKNIMIIHLGLAISLNGHRFGRKQPLNHFLICQKTNTHFIMCFNVVIWYHFMPVVSFQLKSS